MNKTSKIYFSNNPETINNYLESIYTIPNSLQLVVLNLNSQNYSNNNESSVFIKINSGSGELKVKNDSFQVSTGTTLLIPQGISWELSGTLNVNLLFGKPEFPSDYVDESRSVSAKFPFGKLRSGEDEIITQRQLQQEQSQTQKQRSEQQPKVKQMKLNLNKKYLIEILNDEINQWNKLTKEIVKTTKEKTENCNTPNNCCYTFYITRCEDFDNYLKQVIQSIPESELKHHLNVIKNSKHIVYDASRKVFTNPDELFQSCTSEITSSCEYKSFTDSKKAKDTILQSYNWVIRNI
jgi:hypothetical protein